MNKSKEEIWKEHLEKEKANHANIEFREDATIFAAMEEYASQQPSLRWTKKELKELISLAEDGYRLHVSNACHQEFLSEDLDILDRAKKLLSESSPTPKQEDEYKIALQWYKQGIEDAGESIGDGIDADFYDQYGEQFKQSLPKQSQDEKL